MGATNENSIFDLRVERVKEKQKKLQLFLMSISDKDTVKLYIQFFRPK